MRYLIYIFSTFVFFSCAQFVPPTGGETDKKPPILLSSNPSSKSKNFNGRTISLTFDEYIDIASLKQELLITPEPKGLYNSKLKDKTVKIVFDKSLDSNTTYTFNFRNGIKDLNEKNPAKNLKIVLSTGSEIDSLSFSGTVTDIHTKRPVLEATVGLYALAKESLNKKSAQDSLPLLKRKPNYFIKTDSAGKYSFENIKNSNYVLLAFTDKNQNLLYDTKTEYLGYQKDTIRLDSNLTQMDLEIYKANFSKNKIKRVISRENNFVIQLDKEIKKAKVTFDETGDSLDYNYDPISINLFKLKPIKKDTIHTTIFLTDSLNATDTLKQKIYFSQLTATNKKKNIQPLQIVSNIKNNEDLTSKISYDLKFEYPITRFDSSKIIFKTDTLKSEKLNYKFISSTHLNILIHTKAKKQTELFIPSNAIENYRGDTNSVFYIKNTILQKDDLGTLAGSIKETKGTKIVQLLNAESFALVKEISAKEKFSFLDVVPGTYIIRTIYDENSNGIWDPGNFEKNTIPEKIILRKEPIRIRANFEIKDILLN